MSLRCRKQIADVVEYYLLQAVSNTARIACRERPHRPDKVNVQKILWRAKFHEALDAEPDKNFLLKHESWEDIDYILKDSVSLFGVSEDGMEISFVQVKDGENVYSSRHGPFLYISQYNLATHIITLSTESFVKFAEALPDPQVKIIFVANTGRCGSTLLAQMFENLPGLKVLSEPHSILTLLNLFNRGKLSEERYRTLLQSIVKTLVTFEDESIHTIVIKPVFKCTPQIKMLSQLFSGSKVIFLYRNIKDNVDSFMRVMISFSKYAYLFTGDEEMLNYWIYDLPLPANSSQYRWATDPAILSELSLPAAICFNWCCTVACIKTFIHEGLDVLHMDYSRLVSSPQDSWEIISSFCSLPQSEGKPLDAYKKDSQAGAFLSRGVLSSAKIKKKEQAVIDLEIQKMLTAFSLQRPVYEELESVKGVPDKEND